MKKNAEIKITNYLFLKVKSNQTYVHYYSLKVKYCSLNLLSVAKPIKTVVAVVNHMFRLGNGLEYLSTLSHNYR